MKRGSIIFLQVVIVLIGIGIFAWMLWLPPHEGRNANSTLFETYFKDPFLAYVYLASIPFFVGLYQAFKVLGYVRQSTAFSQGSVQAIRTIKYCAYATAGLIVGAVVYIVIAHGGKEDIAGGVSMGVMTTFASLVIASVATVCEKIFQDGVNIKVTKNLPA